MVPSWAYFGVMLSIFGAIFGCRLGSFISDPILNDFSLIFDPQEPQRSLKTVGFCGSDQRCVFLRHDRS